MHSSCAVDGCTPYTLVKDTSGGKEQIEHAALFDPAACMHVGSPETSACMTIILYATRRQRRLPALVLLTSPSGQQQQSRREMLHAMLEDTRDGVHVCFSLPPHVFHLACQYPVIICVGRRYRLCQCNIHPPRSKAYLVIPE